MKPSKLALIMGTHQHRWNAGTCEKCGRVHSPHSFYGETGKCAVCGFPCDHPEGYQYPNSQTHQCRVCKARIAHEKSLLLSQRELCYHCDLCNYNVIPHDCTDSVCDICGYRCTEHDYSLYTTSTTHRCRICNKTEAHFPLIEFSEPNADVCRRCSEPTCPWTAPHDWQQTPSGSDAVGDSAACGVCGVSCGHSYEPLRFGICQTCDAQVCKHPNVTRHPTTDNGISVTCNDCGGTLKHSTDLFYIKLRPYYGAYGTGGVLNGQKFYSAKHYWVEGESHFSQGLTRYLFVLNVTTPTNFGGDYDYTCRGLVFSQTATSLPVNPDLIRADGCYLEEFTQYRKNGSVVASASHKSADWPEFFEIDYKQLILI